MNKIEQKENKELQKELLRNCYNDKQLTYYYNSEELVLKYAMENIERQVHILEASGYVMQEKTKIEKSEFSFRIKGNGPKIKLTEKGIIVCKKYNYDIEKYEKKQKTKKISIGTIISILLAVLGIWLTYKLSK